MGSGNRGVVFVVSVIVVLGLAAGCTASEPATAPTTIPLESGARDTPAEPSIVRYGVASSPSSPWAHYRTSCDTTCGIVFGAVTDTLFATTVDGQLVGLLVERAEVNRDGTVHRWTLRPGITFSDGTSFDADAAKRNIDACRHSLLTGPGLAGIDGVRADGLELTITSLAPWPTLPAHFAETPCGHMFSAAWLASLPDLPMREAGSPYFDSTVAREPAIGEPALPIGLGAFTVTSFDPGSGNSMVLEANPSYWRGSGGITGESLPVVDRVELVVIEDEATRRGALEAGQFDLVHAVAPESRELLASRSSLSTWASTAFADTVHLLVNGAESPEPGGSVFARQSCRRAVARSIDHVAVVESIGEVTIATGPFAPGSPGHDPERERPVFDPNAATRWAERCGAELVDSAGDAADELDGSRRVRLIVGSGDPRAEMVASMIDGAFDAATDVGAQPAVDVEIVELPAADLGLAALLGDFDLLLWENHGGVHPDLEFEWWYGGAAQPVGAVSTNVGRIDDPALDRALVDLRRATDQIEVARSAGEIHRAFDANSWATWLYWTEWMVAWGPDTDVDPNRTSPEGVALAPMINGVHWLHGVRELDPAADGSG